MQWDAFLKEEFWQQEWAAFWSAFWSMSLLLVALVIGVWWLRGWMSKREMGGLKGEILLLERQLKDAADKSVASGTATDKVERRIKILEEALANKADIVALSALTSQIQSAVGEMATANNAVSSTLFAALRTTEAQDSANFTIDLNKRSENWSIEWQQKELDKMKRDQEFARSLT